MKKHTLSALVIALFVSGSVSAASALSVPEKLIFEVSWSGIKAGTAVQEVTSRDGELHILYTVRSSGWLDSFFPIDDSSESVLSRGGAGEPFGMTRFFSEMINEGKTHSLKEARFDPAGLQVVTKDLLKHTEKSDALSSKTFDTLSCIYFIRASELEPGKPIQLDMFDLKRVWKTEVRVVRREVLRTPRGKFNTIVVRPTLSSEGMKPRNDYLTVWLSDDERRIPVKMTVKLKVGEFEALLVGGSYWH
jgi:hypothetical protein